MNEQEWEDKLAEVQKNSEHWYNKYKELENKIADIKANCDFAIEGRDIKIKELEQENAELRNNGFTVSAMTEQQLKVAIEKGEQLEKKNAKLEKDFRICEHNADTYYDQLSKAKEIIALGLRVCETSSIEYMNLYQKQAEQFLKEIEK